MPQFTTTLTVNATPIELFDFPQEFLTQTILAAVSTLKKVGEIKELDVSFQSGETTVIVNGIDIPLGHFPASFIVGTFSGLVSVLKGVDKNIESFQIKVG
jgi:hypothetical protein